MVLNNPRTREALVGAAAQVNARVRQGVDAYVEQRLEQAVAPLQARIAELEARLDRLERRPPGTASAEGATAAGTAAPRRASHLDRDSI